MAILIIGIYRDNVALKKLKSYDSVIGLFRSVWPSEFDRLMKSRSMTHDLKLICMLTVSNLGSNIYIKAELYEFVICEYKKLLFYDSIFLVNQKSYKLLLYEVIQITRNMNLLFFLSGYNHF